MKKKFIIIFLLSVLVPTALLAYFGLLAVMSEKSIVEKNMTQKYEAMAGIVIGDINSALKGVPNERRTDPSAIQPVLFKHTLLFPDEVMIFDMSGKAVDGVRSKKDFEAPAFSTKIPDLPYEISVFERYPQITAALNERRLGVYIYIGMISLSAVLIIAGGLFSLWALSKEWREARLRSEFASHISHEIRRPLTSIRMFSEMLKTNRVPSDAKRMDYYCAISNESEKLTNLANNMLDFSRIENGQMRYDFKPSDIAKLVTDTIHRFKGYMADEPRQIELNVSSDLPLVKVDAEAVSQALINLLTNAIKYSPPDKDIRVTLKKENDKIVISVIDHGIGVPANEQKRIFDKFYRTTQKQVVEREGSGLGLTLVRSTAEAHHGWVEVKSEEAKGSEFSIILKI